MTEPQHHWDGTRWLTWDGSYWVEDPVQAPPPPAAPAEAEMAAPEAAPEAAPLPDVPDTPAPAKETSAGLGCGALAVTVIVLVVIWAAVASCGSSSGTGAGGGDSDAALACNHFRNVMGDVAKGVLTDTELRDKLKEVNSNAAIAPPAIQIAANDMLAAMTSGGTEALVTATAQMDAACKANGH